MAKVVEEKLELMKDIVNSEVEAACAAQLLVVSSCWRTPASTTKKTARTRMLMATRSSPILAKMADVYCSNAFSRLTLTAAMPLAQHTVLTIP